MDQLWYKVKARHKSIILSSMHFEQTSFSGKKKKSLQVASFIISMVHIGNIICYPRFIATTKKIIRK